MTNIKTPPTSTSRQLFTIAGGHLFHDIYNSFLAPLLPQLIETFSLSLTSAGLLTTFSRLPSILNPFVGYIADKAGAKYFVIFTPAITATLMSLLGIAPSPLHLGIILFLAGTSSTIFHASSPAMVAEATVNNTGYGMSIFMAGGGLGRALGPLLVVWGISQYGLSGLYRLSFLGWAASLILFIQFRKIKLMPRKDFSLSTAFPLFKKFFIPLILVLILRNTLSASLYTYLPIYMVQSGAPFWMAGLSLSALEISGVIGALIIGPLSDRVGRRKSINISMLISASVVPAFLHAKGWFVIPFLVILGFFSLSTSTLFLALIQDHFQEHRATGNGIYLLISLLSNALMLVVVGRIGDIAGLRFAYYLSSAAALLSIPILKLIPKVDRN